MTGVYRTQPAMCAECGASFMALSCKVAKGRGRFCSRLCSSRANIRHARRAPKRPLAADDPRRTHIAAKAIIGPSLQENEMLVAAFWERVDKRCPGECWQWIGNKGADGYGVLSRNGKAYRATRLSWQFHNDTPLGMLHVLHRCDNPICVNPNHLWAGTAADNMRDASNKGRLQKPLNTHCRQGHALTPETTYNDVKDGRPRRRCKICMAEEQRRYRAKKADKRRPIELPDQRKWGWRR